MYQRRPPNIGVKQMISQDVYDNIIRIAQKYRYSSMRYLDYDDCKNAEILYDCNDWILLRDGGKTPALLHFATDDFAGMMDRIADVPGKLRLNFVPQEFAAQAKEIGFTEWGEYVDCWNRDLASTAERLEQTEAADYLGIDECAELSAMSRKCAAQSRGFEGESPEWFVEWLKENQVIVQRKVSGIVGYCCVSIYNEGTTLWIREIGVDPGHQGMGLGKRLMEQAIRYGVERGAAQGFLAVDVLNANAIGLYESYDFYIKNTDSELQMVRL